MIAGNNFMIIRDIFVIGVDYIAYAMISVGQDIGSLDPDFF